MTYRIKISEGAEILFVLVVFIGASLFTNVGGHQSERLIAFLNVDKYQDTYGYQTFTSLNVWESAELFRFGLKGPIEKSVPGIRDEMVITATVQLWGKIGVMLMVMLSVLQFTMLNNSVSNAKDPKIALLGFGLFVVYIQSIFASTMISIGMHPPSHQVAGAGFFSSGNATVFAFIVVALGYRVLFNQKFVSSILITSNDNQNSLLVGRGYKAYNMAIWCITIIISMAAFYST